MDEAWVRIPTQAEAMSGPGARPAGHPYYFGFVPAMGRLLAAHRRIGPAFQALYGEVMFAPGRANRRGAAAAGLTRRRWPHSRRRQLVVSAEQDRRADLLQ